MESLVSTLIAVAILAAIAFLIWRGRPTRESIRRKKAVAAGLTDEFFQQFEQRAVQIAKGILGAASDRLRTEAERLALPDAETLAVGDSSGEPLGAPTRIRGAARDLSEALANLRRLREISYGSPEFERAEENWAYLAVSYADRYPLLAGFIERADASGLERIHASSKLEATRLLRSELDARLSSYEDIQLTLTEDSSVIWSVLSLVVLTLSQLDSSETEQSALAARADARATDTYITLIGAQLQGALRILHGVPPAERVSHQGVLALPLEDRDLGAALVQYRANEATAQGELDQARVLTMGDSTMLWLAHDVVRVCAYPDEAIAAYAKLAPLARKVLRCEAAEREPAKRDFAEKAAEHLDEQTHARALSTLEGLTSGRTPEQLRGGSAGHEAGEE